MSIKSIYLLEAHSWDVSKYYSLPFGNNKYHLSIAQSIKECTDEYLVAFITDSLCVNRVVDYFPKNRRIALLKESPLHTRLIDTDFLKKQFSLVLTHREDLVSQGDPFSRVDFSSNWVSRDPLFGANLHKTKLVSFIGSIQHDDRHGYALRKEIAKYLCDNEKIDTFGWGINTIEYKTQALDKYRFSIVMENCRENYYYTEKLIDCLLSETIPVYWGCPKIPEIFDRRGIIEFEHLDELINIIPSLSVEKYDSLFKYALENKRRCVEMQLDSYESFLSRCVKAAIAHGFFPNNLEPIKIRSKYTAAFYRSLNQKGLLSR